MPTICLNYHEKKFSWFKQPMGLNASVLDKFIKIGLELEFEFNDVEDEYYDENGEWIHLMLMSMKEVTLLES